MVACGDNSNGARHAHEEEVRKEGYPKYVISDRNDQRRLVAAGKREEYYPILFAEPSPDNDSLLGLDLGSDATGRAAMRQAAAAGRATMAVCRTLSDDKTGENLLFMLEPARYESVASQLTKRPDDQPETDGFVLTVFRMEAMANKWLSLPEFKIPPAIEIYISANEKALASRQGGTSPLPFRGATAALTSAPAESPLGGVRVREKFVVGDTNFAVVFVAPARYIAEFASWKPVMASLAGLLITGLMVGYFWLLTGQMASVERQVADRWRELRERERYIRHLVDNTSDMIFLRDEQGKILDINKRACEKLGYSRKELLSMAIADLVVAEDPESFLVRSTEECPQTFATAYRRKDGTLYPVEVHVTSVGTGPTPLILAIVSDITDRKRAESTS